MQKKSNDLTRFRRTHGAPCASDTAVSTPLLNKCYAISSAACSTCALGSFHSQRQVSDRHFKQVALPISSSLTGYSFIPRTSADTPVT